MWLEVKEVKRCKNGAFGNFRSYREKDGSSLITISMSKNKTLSEYGATLIHELLHFWVTALRKKGYTTTNRKEHRFINDAEKRCLYSMKKHLRKKKKT